MNLEQKWGVEPLTFPNGFISQINMMHNCVLGSFIASDDKDFENGYKIYHGRDKQPVAYGFYENEEFWDDTSHNTNRVLSVMAIRWSKYFDNITMFGLYASYQEPNTFAVTTHYDSCNYYDDKDYDTSGTYHMMRIDPVNKCFVFLKKRDCSFISGREYKYFAVWE